MSLDVQRCSGCEYIFRISSFKMDQAEKFEALSMINPEWKLCFLPYKRLLAAVEEKKGDIASLFQNSIAFTYNFIKLEFINIESVRFRHYTSSL